MGKISFVLAFTPAINKICTHAQKRIIVTAEKLLKQVAGSKVKTLGEKRGFSLKYLCLGKSNHVTTGKHSDIFIALL